MCIVGYLDANWDGDLDQCKSTSSNALLLQKDVISWSNKKYACIVLSTIDAKFIACSTTMQEDVWLTIFFENLGA